MKLENCLEDLVSDGTLYASFISLLVTILKQHQLHQFLNLMLCPLPWVLYSLTLADN